MTSKNLHNEKSFKHINILAIFKNKDEYQFYDDHLHEKSFQLFMMEIHISGLSIFLSN